MEIGPREIGDMDVSTEREKEEAVKKEKRLTDMDGPHLELLLLLVECVHTVYNPADPPPPLSSCLSHHNPL